MNIKMKIKTQLVIIAALMLAGTAFSAPIHDAAMYGNLAGVRAELDKGVDVNLKNDFGETPLDIALWLNDASETADLIRKRGGKTSKELIALSDAVRTGNIEDVKKHLAAGADVNAKDMYEDTPLYEAVKLGYRGIAELLLANGADVNVKNNVGWVPLHIATALDHKEIVELLVTNGAYVDAKDDDGSTPMHYAAWYDRKEVAELLIANGADVNAKDDGGDTPLDMVEGEEIADILREHGGRTGHELAPVFRLDYSTDQWLFGFTFAAKDGMAYVVEVTQDFKQWGVLETIEGTGKQVKFIDSRQPLVPFKRSFYRVKEVE